MCWHKIEYLENLMEERWDKPGGAPWGSRGRGEEKARDILDPWASRSYWIDVQDANWRD